MHWNEIYVDYRLICLYFGKHNFQNDEINFDDEILCFKKQKE